MKLLHVITALNVGGAETMLAKLLEQPAYTRNGVTQEVLSLMAPGPMAERIGAAGVPVHSLGMGEGQLSLAALGRLVRIARAIRPDAIMGWMHHGHLAATLAAQAVRPRPALIWNVRHSLSDIAHEKRLTRIVLRCCAKLSNRPDAILYNAQASRTQYADFGYSDAHALVLPNGVDCRRFRPGADARALLREEFGVAEKSMVVGMVARAHPMKDPETLISAVERARRGGLDLHLLIVGKGMEYLRDNVAAALPPDRVTLIGQRGDVADWLSGLDMLVLPSAWGEGFPNILGEAMASGVPCIATDVGDSGWIVGSAGRIVPPRDVPALTRALIELAMLGDSGRKALGMKGRARVIERFSMPEVSASYSRLYDAMIDRRRGIVSGVRGQPEVVA